MARKPTAKQTETDVLTKSRRRCAICYGLYRDTSLKPGQIAHLDHDNQNPSEDNLCFLCLVHHDEYDSTTSQRKGLTKEEVRAYREELYKAVNQVLTLNVHFGNVTLPPEDPYAGHFTRINSGSDSAEIEIIPVPDGIDGTPRYFVSGLALWGTGREGGPNIGELAVVMEMFDEGQLWAHDYSFSPERPHKIRLSFKDNALTVSEENGSYGLNVTFDGEYRRA